ncbi:hypothetical protein DWU98_03160 [Dyella monticola]|uniref:YXWGXW repeat-containing protein n=2 Tax=Dyella monticola TaxID=1927958 RepID=A0A370XA64_9GAMM|nr:hypothetical protein DWU98_03160 [Dyella monticola]
MTHTQDVSGRTWLVRALAGLLGAAAVLAAFPQKADAGVFIGVGVSVGVPPPPLPIYAQPPIPGAGYIWTPGYWAWDGYEYYWVPGTWVMAPFYGALWTPGYWGWDGAVFLFHRGYWGYHVGFYGGVNYGFGYTGVGYAGGYWGHGGFYYNHAVNRFGNVHIANVYNRTVINNVTRVSYNGGRGGMTARATAQDMAYAHQARMGPIAAQQQQAALASHNPAMRMSVNHGAPTIAATARPGAFTGAGVVSAHGAVAGRFTTAAASVHSASVVHAPASMQHSNTALRSAGFAPHTGAGTYHPGSVNGAMHPTNAYRPPSNAYRSNAYRAAPAYRAAQPQSHAYHPASAPRSGGAPHGGGGGHEPSHHG